MPIFVPIISLHTNVQNPFFFIRLEGTKNKGCSKVSYSVDKECVFQLLGFLVACIAWQFGFLVLISRNERWSRKDRMRAC